MEHITRCPACKFAFHVTDDQMRLAAGKVRCGACLSIFDARSHIESQFQKPLADDGDELLIHDDMNPAAIAIIADTLPEQSEPAAPPQPDSTPTEAPVAATARQPGPRLKPEPVITPGGDESAPESPLDIALPDSADYPFGAPRHRRPFSAVACVLALFLLAGQYIYFHFARLAADPGYYPWLASTCKLIGCQVPPFADVAKITPARLAVVEHPLHPRGLLMEAVLENRAQLPQPFPNLLLKFENVNGATVAQRRFQPGEYLFGELSGVTLFPPHRPVRIRLELEDPGPDATNYQLSPLPR